MRPTQREPIYYYFELISCFRELQDLEARDVNSLISTLPFVDLSFINEVDEENCLDSDLPCDYTRKYRTLSGWCNNLEHPEYGQSYRPFIRFLPPVYTDGNQSILLTVYPCIVYTRMMESIWIDKLNLNQYYIGFSMTTS